MVSESRRWEPLVRVGPHGGAHRVAARAGLSVLVPLLVLWAVGRLEWSIFAAFGAFTSLYGRNHVQVPRLAMQLRLGVLLALVTAAGVAVGTSEHRAWLAVPLAALLAGGASLLSDAQDWHPPGALFPVFAFTACASLPSDPGDVATALVVAGGSAAFSLVVGAAGGWWRHVRSRTGDRAQELDPHFTRGTPLRRVDPALSLRWHALPSAVAVLVAGALATGGGIGHPYWAMVSAVVPFAARDFAAQVVRALHRVVGTFAGLGVSALLFWLDPRGLVLILVVAALQVGAELLVGRNYALALTVITPLALLMVHLVSPTGAGVLIVDRGVETLIGVAVGVAVGYLGRPGSHLGPAAPRRMAA